MPSIHETLGYETLTPDEKWKALNKNLIDSMRNMDWGFYRNTKYTMAQFLISEKRLLSALRALYEVCYIDINGPMNTNYENVKENAEHLDEIFAEFPPFDPDEFTDFAPAVVGQISELAIEQSLDIEALRKGFLEVAEKWYENVKLPVPPYSRPDFVDLPVSPSEAWEKFETAFGGNI